MIVANAQSGSVALFAAAAAGTPTFVNTLGADDYYLAYDSGTNQVFVSNEGAETVTFFSLGPAASTTSAASSTTASQSVTTAPTSTTAIVSSTQTSTRASTEATSTASSSSNASSSSSSKSSLSNDYWMVVAVDAGILAVLGWLFAFKARKSRMLSPAF